MLLFPWFFVFCLQYFSGLKFPYKTSTQISPCKNIFFLPLFIEYFWQGNCWFYKAIIAVFPVDYIIVSSYLYLPVYTCEYDLLFRRLPFRATHWYPARWFQTVPWGNNTGKIYSQGSRRYKYQWQTLYNQYSQQNYFGYPTSAFLWHHSKFAWFYQWLE